jgi:Tfp pilus assembly protein PilE
MNDAATPPVLPRRFGVAFKIIEYLVAFAILFVLFSIFCAPYPNSREKARGASCASNMKQIGMAFGQYLADFDDTYPTFDDSRVKTKVAPPVPGAKG